MKFCWTHAYYDAFAARADNNKMKCIFSCVRTSSDDIKINETRKK